MLLLWLIASSASCFASFYRLLRSWSFRSEDRGSGVVLSSPLTRPQRQSPLGGGVFVLRRPHEAVLSSAKIFVGWSGPCPGFASFDHSASTPLLPAPDGRSWFCRFSPAAGLCGSAAASSASSTCGRKWALPSRCWTLFAASSSSSSLSLIHCALAGISTLCNFHATKSGLPWNETITNHLGFGVFSPDLR